MATEGAPEHESLSQGSPGSFSTGVHFCEASLPCRQAGVTRKQRIKKRAEFQCHGLTQIVLMIKI